MPAMVHVPIESVPNLAKEIAAKREAESQSFPVRSTYASKIGHPCDRYLTYHRTAWDLIPKPDAGLMGIFRRGKIMGDDIALEAAQAMKRLGFDVVEQEVSIPPNEYDIGGRIDFGILVTLTPGTRPVFVPVEAKTMHPGYFDQLPDGDDEAIAWMMNHPSAYMRCYPAQLMTYCHFRKIDLGLIFVRCPTTFRDRQIVLRYSEEAMSAILDRAAALKTRVAKIETERKGPTDGDFLAAIDAKGLLPDRIDFDPGICGKCDFCPWCVPDITRAQGIVDLLSDADLNEDCRILQDMRNARDAYESANVRVGNHCKAIVAQEKPGTTKTVLTKDFGIIVKKTAKQTSKKILPLADILKGVENDD